MIVFCDAEVEVVALPPTLADEIREAHGAIDSRHSTQARKLMARLGSEAASWLAVAPDQFKFSTTCQFESGDVLNDESAYDAVEGSWGSDIFYWTCPRCGTEHEAPAPERPEIEAVI